MRPHLPAGLLTIALIAPRPAPAESTDRLARTVALAPGKPIRLDATIAEVTIAGSDRSDLQVEIVRHAPAASDLMKLPAIVDEQADAIHISALQAGDARDAALRADISVSAPAAAVLQAVRVFEGRVKLANLKGSCDVDVRRGPIEGVSLAGRVRLESGLGGIDLRQPELTPGGMLRLRVFNGPLRVRFARPPANARILAVTFNGTLTSDIPLTMKDKFGPRFGETTIGTGEPVMSVDVVKGDIAISVGK